MLFEFIQIEAQNSKNYFNFFLITKAEAPGNNKKKEPHEPHPKLKIYICLIFTEDVCPACNSVQEMH